MAPEHTIEEMIKILAYADCSEGYIISPKGKLLGKVSLPMLIKQGKEKNQLDKNKYEKYLSLSSNNSVLEAIDIIKDFVGESVPVVDDNGHIIGAITESDLFSSLLKAEKNRNEEELG